MRLGIGMVAKWTAAAILACAAGALPARAQEPEPIAYIGHGAFFEATGRQIPVTEDFVRRAQAWYRARLLEELSPSRKKAFARFETRLMSVPGATGQAELVLRQRALEYLVAGAKDLPPRMLGKIRALKVALARKLPLKELPGPPPSVEAFGLDPKIEEWLKNPEITIGDVTILSVTNADGEAHVAECRDAGVPIPPPINRMDSAGRSGWRSHGFIPQGQQFIVGTPAEVRTFETDDGVCFALPRYTDQNRVMVMLDGVICQGATTAKVCFWDNQMNGDGFWFPAGVEIPIGAPDLSINALGQYQGGGAEIEFGSGGVCTDCHAGQNPYIIHPDADLGGVTMGQLGEPPLSLKTFASRRYEPIVGASWPQNDRSMSPSFVPPGCVRCHVDGGSGGAFPHLSTEYSDGYCGTILAGAVAGIQRPDGVFAPPTMPQTNPGSLVNDPDVIAFRAWCGEARESGPSDRGDPHLISTDGVSWDFQAAGEFTALRDSSTGFELQTRQAGVATTFTPGANPYTGLASCVSLNTAVALRVGKRRVTYQPSSGRLERRESLELRVDGRLVRAPGTPIDVGGGNSIHRADVSGGIDVRLADGSRVIVIPTFWESQGYWYLNVDVVGTAAREGTMGTILPGQWLPLGPDGRRFGPAPSGLGARHALLNGEFADAWRVTDGTSLFDYAPGTSTASFTNRDWPAPPGKECGGAGGGAPPVEPLPPDTAKKLCGGIQDDAVRENCIFDVMATGEAGMAKSYRRSLRARSLAMAP